MSKEDSKKPSVDAKKDEAQSSASSDSVKKEAVKKDEPAKVEPVKEATKEATKKDEPAKEESVEKSAKAEETSDVAKKEPVKKEAQASSEKKEPVKEEATKKDEPVKKSPEGLLLQALFVRKKGMTNIYEKNKYIPCTVLKYDTCRVTQIKTKEKDGYSAVQVALESNKTKSRALQNHLKKAGLKKGAEFIREVRQTLPENIKLGQSVSIESLKKGDSVRITGVSKGHGFAGVVKRWGFGGGPASHGAEKHRTTGSIANTATQGRVFPGKKMPGHFGCDTITIPKAQVVQVLPQKGLILVKGSVPGAIQSLIEVRKRGTTHV